MIFKKQWLQWEHNFTDNYYNYDPERERIIVSAPESGRELQGGKWGRLVGESCTGEGLCAFYDWKPTMKISVAMVLK